MKVFDWFRKFLLYIHAIIYCITGLYLICDSICESEVIVCFGIHFIESLCSRHYKHSFIAIFLRLSCNIFKT